jgi:hypothetical protein
LTGFILSRGQIKPQPLFIRKFFIALANTPSDNRAAVDLRLRRP